MAAPMAAASCRSPPVAAVDRRPRSPLPMSAARRRRRPPADHRPDRAPDRPPVSAADRPPIVPDSTPLESVDPGRASRRNSVLLVEIDCPRGKESLYLAAEQRRRNAIVML
jgi:hypothetical protein